MKHTGNLTTIVQGAMLDKKFEPTIGSPLLFYCFSTVTNDALLFKNDDDILDQYKSLFKTVKLYIKYYNRLYKSNIKFWY